MNKFIRKIFLTGFLLCSFSNATVIPITPWAAYTPTFTGFGTVSTFHAYWRRVGDTLHLRLGFVCGTSTAVEARVSLPNSVVINSTLVPAIQVVANGVLDRTNSTEYDYHANMTGGNSYINFGYRNVATAPIAKFNGSDVCASGHRIHFTTMEIPITGW